MLNRRPAAFIKQRNSISVSPHTEPAKNTPGKSHRKRHQRRKQRRQKTDNCFKTDAANGTDAAYSSFEKKINALTVAKPTPQTAPTPHRVASQTKTKTVSKPTPQMAPTWQTAASKKNRSDNSFKTDAEAAGGNNRCLYHQSCRAAVCQVDVHNRCCHVHHIQELFTCCWFCTPVLL